MSKYEISTPKEFSLKDEITLAFIFHPNDIYREPGLVILDIPDTEFLFGSIKNKQGRSTQVALAKFQDSEVATLIVDGKKYIIGDHGAIPESYESKNYDPNALETDLMQIIKNVTWGSIDSGSPI